MNRALSIRAIAALTLVSTQMPAVAESGALGSNVARPYQVVSKTEAILGGAPSRLAAIMAAQGGQSSSISPSAPGMRAAVERMITPRLVPVDRPDVFGSVALAISSTPLDKRWQKVSIGSPGAAASAYAASLRDEAPLAQIDAVNRYVNSRVAFNSDSRMFGTEDRWMSGVETLSRGQGDCEDFAIAKMQMLRRAGFADKDLYLVVLRDMRRAADHAVLVVRAEGRLLVLDNGTNRIVDSDTLSDYRPILSYSGARAWTHGYRREAPTLNYAVAQSEPAPVKVASSAPTDVQSATIAAATLSAASMALRF